MKTNFVQIFLVAVMVVCGLQARAATVTATLDPAEISMGETAQLTVTVSGGQDSADRPVVDGLEITPVGQSTQIQIVNGAVTANASNTYAVTPQHEGSFVIPAIHAGSAVSQPVTLRVGRSSAATPSAAQAQNLPPPSTGPVVTPPGANSTAANDTTPAMEKFGSIQVILPKKEFYEGELVPVEVRAYLDAEAQPNVTDLPQLSCDGFALNSLSNKPQQGQQVVNGRVYIVLIWHSALTAVKTGEYPLSLKMPATVVVMSQMQMAPQGNGFDDFFRNAFASMGQRKNVMLKNKVETLKVLPLPREGRPADFSGAVGQFEVDATASPLSVNAGDPITLKLKVTGVGNFDRISSDVLPNAAPWKTYSPKTHFDAVDSVGYQGTKTFEQPIIPSDSSVTSIPALSFSFFNPEKREYVTRTAPPIAISVAGGTPAPLASAAPAGTPAPAAKPTSDLRPNQVEPGSFVSTLRPIYLNPIFIAGQGIPFFALLGGLLFLRARRQGADPNRAQATATQRAIAEQVAAMDAAMRDHQAGPFFVHARNALQQRLGQRWNLRPETITLAEINERLGGEAGNVRPIFEMADQASYSDLHLGDADLQQWRQAVMSELEEKN